MTTPEKPPNPYQVSASDTGPAMTPVPPNQLDFPGRWKTIITIAIASSVLMLGSLSAADRVGEGFILLFVVIWAGTCALISAILPGTPARKIARALLGTLLAVPFFALYATVCATIAIPALAVANMDIAGLGFGSVVANLVVLMIFALTVRGIARSQDRRHGEPVENQPSQPKT
ncbi:hypothetical protein [Rhodopirellula sp. MGV]|uniref:hypothetical protein n=1 Tax=Rhodopirellula sp. MGV TaxID=2023130 RepID=UPI000B9782DB|nr:hypothetical protein [Rhodopirellula sp. MGV]OYP37034.1 hypothetical protein CGZ80_06695 [Rhodopirellula sp. MGV]PNY36204.1 hypothetical protein C2E31_13890 [Rhodopirellula baltica]